MIDSDWSTVWFLLWCPTFSLFWHWLLNFWYHDGNPIPVFDPVLCFPAGSALQDSAFGYFITACVVILLAIVSYFALPKLVRFNALTVEIHICVSFPLINAEKYNSMFTFWGLKRFAVQEFFQWYSESNGSRPSADEENKMDLLKPGNAWQ